MTCLTGMHLKQLPCALDVVWMLDGAAWSNTRYKEVRVAAPTHLHRHDVMNGILEHNHVRIQEQNIVAIRQQVQIGLRL